MHCTHGITVLHSMGLCAGRLIIVQVTQIAATSSNLAQMFCKFGNIYPIDIHKFSDWNYLLILLLKLFYYKIHSKNS